MARKSKTTKTSSIAAPRSTQRVEPLHHPSTLLLPPDERLRSAIKTEWGELYAGDCLHLLRALPDHSVEMVFADPPFNLGKDYGRGVDDQMVADEYLRWSKMWLAESIRVLVPGGALFVFNLPRWLVDYGAFLGQSGMTFRHWIALRMPKAYPRGKRLSPAHYGCLYYTKGEPKTFNKVYVPIQTCRHCGGEIRDYGGHRKALNAKGINLMDVIDAPEDVWIDAEAPLKKGHGFHLMDELWDDIPPVRHSKYKTRGANELAPLMLERLIALATNEGEIVVDPFGGSGTTFIAAERLHRRWIGTELGDTTPAVQRLQDAALGIDARWERARGKAAVKRGPSDQLPLIKLK